MATLTGNQAILEQLLADGFTHLFGNPGTSEEGFLDALTGYPALHYVLCLQESVAVLAADGYARATGKAAAVQIHSTPGLGNAIGALYQAHRGHSPLVVIGGDAGIRYQAMDAQMAGPLVKMAEPVTKWATMVQEPSSLLRVLRKAIKIASTPPKGPVYVCLPVDILDAPVVEEVRPTSIPSTRVAPDPATIDEIASILLAARTPMIFVGDGVADSDAQDELVALAETIGAEVWAADAGEVNLPFGHPLYQGMTGHMFGYESLPTTRKGDANLICGTYMLPEVFPELGPIFAPGSRSVHIDLNAYEIAKNHPVDIGVVADPKRTLQLVNERCKARANQEQAQAAGARARAIAQAGLDRHNAQVAQDRARADAYPLAFSRFAGELAARLPADALVFDEALTSSPPLTRYLRPGRPRSYFITRGGSLGVGIPGAIGAKIAHRDRTVIGFTGDGGAMYTIQALWTAVRHGLDVKFVVCNNRSYRLLQINLLAYWRERGRQPGDYPLSFDLSEPPLRFDAIAESYGIASARVERPEDVGPAIDRMLSHPGPFLLDVILEGDVHPELIGVRCGQ
ncbi:MAG: thiamine pyrophosphate-binding protein [Isosphaeraceae bacterium]